jgi:hypothetical protein
MTLTAQQQFVFGAMCMDEQFRNQLFAAGDAPPAERRVQISALIQSYGNGQGVEIDNSVADNVMNVVASASPCRQAAMTAFQEVKAEVCPCWPCF